MNRQKETLKFKGEEIFESSLLENNWFLFERYKRDQEDVLHLAYRSTEVFSQALLQLENDLRLYLSKYCVKNQGGQFLKETKEFVSGLYKKLPEEPEEILERIADLILGIYSKEKKGVDKKEKRKDEETKKENLERLSEEELIELANDLRLWLKNEIKDKEGRILKKAEKVVSALWGKLPKESDSARTVEQILNLILDYYSEKSKRDTKGS